jgi:hypothetical protein
MTIKLTTSSSKPSVCLKHLSSLVPASVLPMLTLFDTPCNWITMYWKFTEQNTVIFLLKIQFLHTFLTIVLNPGKLKSSSERSLSMLSAFRRNMNAWQTCHNLYFVGLQSQHCVKCYANQIAPTFHYRQPSSTLYGSITFTMLKRQFPWPILRRHRKNHMFMEM